MEAQGGGSWGDPLYGRWAGSEFHIRYVAYTIPHTLTLSCYPCLTTPNGSLCVTDGASCGFADILMGILFLLCILAHIFNRRQDR